MTSQTGLFVGTFDPFTLGHASIVRRMLPLFGRLVIGVVGDNVHKPQMTPAATRVEAIKRLYAADERIIVQPYYGLAVDLARSVGARYIIKGVRSARDFEYEREQADVNRLITGGDIETILVMAEPELQSLSSTMVRELRHFGHDVSPFLPKAPADSGTATESPQQQQ